MIPIDTDTNTRPVGAPRDWDEEKNGPCMTLHIQDVDIGGANYQVSTWMLTGDELDALIAQRDAGGGAMVRLGIRGIVHPVIMLWVE